MPTPEKTIPLFSVQPFGDAKTTGTPTTRKKEIAMKAKRVNWKRSVIRKSENRKRNRFFKPIIGFLFNF